MPMQMRKYPFQALDLCTSDAGLSQRLKEGKLLDAFQAKASPIQKGFDPFVCSPGKYISKT